MPDTTFRAKAGSTELKDQNSGSANERDAHFERERAITPSEFSLAMRARAHQGTSAIGEHVT